MISNKVQINDVVMNGDAPMVLNGEMVTGWRDITTSDKLVIKGSIKRPMSLSKLGMVLQQAGFQGKRMGKLRTRGWIVLERITDEINASRNIEAKG